MSPTVTSIKANQSRGNVMNDEEFKIFCSELDKREQEGELPHYPAPARNFLRSELAIKSADVREAVLTWVKTGKKTELTIPELTVTRDFWSMPLCVHIETHNDKSSAALKRLPITTTMLEKVRKMNYIAAAFTIDWIRREPRKALAVLHRGML